MWYPENKRELNSVLKGFLKTGKHKKKINGLIVPHAGYEYSGRIAGRAYSLIKSGDYKRAVVIGPSHYVQLFDALASNREYWETPLGKIKVFSADFDKGDIYHEHSIKNQIPFLQKQGVKEIMPLMIGKITEEQALNIAKKISKIKALFVFSSDLSHFLPYSQAVETDKRTIKIIENLYVDEFKYLDACGYFPLLIMKELCRLKKWKPCLIDYKNSGDIIGDKSDGVVGYAGFYF